MKVKYILPVALLLFLIAAVSAEPFTPDSGAFAFREVDIFEINGINFTVPTDYNLTDEDATHMEFAHDKDALNISVDSHGKVKKVKSDKSKNLTSSKTMLGSTEGYLVENNTVFTFSYKDCGKLVTITSADMPLIIGVMGKD